MRRPSKASEPSMPHSAPSPRSKSSSGPALVIAAGHASATNTSNPQVEQAVKGVEAGA